MMLLVMAIITAGVIVGAFVLYEELLYWRTENRRRWS